MPHAERRTSANRRPHSQPLTLELLEGRCLPSFMAPIDAVVGQAPLGVVAADFNGDSVADVAVANYASNTVSVLYGLGGGYFRPALHYAVGNLPVGIAAGDWDNDGLVDLAATNSSTDSVTVMLKDPLQPLVFHLGGVHPVGSTPLGIAVGRFSISDLGDLVVANFGSDSVSFLLTGGCSGDFGPARTVDLAPESRPVSVAVADFDGTGWPDVAGTTPGNAPSGDVTVLLSSGGLVFQQQQYLAGPSPSGIAVADFDNNTWWDLVVTKASGNTVAVLLNDCSWSPLPGTLFRSPTAPGLPGIRAERGTAYPPGAEHVPVFPPPDQGGRTRSGHAARARPQSLDEFLAFEEMSLPLLPASVMELTGP